MWGRDSGERRGFARPAAGLASLADQIPAHVHARRDDEHPAGTVEVLTAGLVKGYIDRFAPGENAHALSLAEGLDLPEVRYFLETFVPSFRLTLDELN